MKWVQPQESSQASSTGSRIDRGREPSQQLAIDEAMLQMADESPAGESSERIRVWQFDQPVVVLGRSSRVADEVNREVCEQHGIPLHRRSSGGATVLGGPGCLMYSVVLSFDDQPDLKNIDRAHCHVMKRLTEAIHKQVPTAEHQGICDLTLADRKFSGNSLRLARRHLLYHGTLLYDFDLDLLAACLDFAPRQPDYRRQRTHDRFVTNITMDPEKFAEDLSKSFLVSGEVSSDLYTSRAAKLRTERYETDAWRFRH